MDSKNLPGAEKKALNYLPGQKVAGLTPKELPIGLVVPNPNQPRKFFSDKEVASLAESLKKEGFLQPLVVLPLNKEGYYFLLAGERRYRAARKLGLAKVPVLVKEASKSDALRLALVENLQRQDLGVVEEALAYQELIKEHNYTHEQCAEVLGLDRSKVTNSIRLLGLPERALEALVKDKISMGHARALLALKERKLLLIEVLELALKKGLSVRQTEKLCQKLKNNRENSVNDNSVLAGVNPDMEYYADLLRQTLKTKVKLTGEGGRGKIEISYFSAAEFERLFKIFCGS